MPDLTVTERAWHDLAPVQDGTPDTTAAAMALYALAHIKAFHGRTLPVLNLGPERGGEPTQAFLDAVRASNRQNMEAFVAGFIAAALAKGWTTEHIRDVLDNDTQLAEEKLWDWIAEAGIDAMTVASADAPITTGFGLTTEKWEHLRKVGFPTTAAI